MRRHTRAGSLNLSRSRWESASRARRGSQAKPPRTKSRRRAKRGLEVSSRWDPSSSGNTGAGYGRVSRGELTRASRAPLQFGIRLSQQLCHESVALRRERALRSRVVEVAQALEDVDEENGIPGRRVRVWLSEKALVHRDGRIDGARGLVRASEWWKVAGREPHLTQLGDCFRMPPCGDMDEPSEIVVPAIDVPVALK